MKKHKLFTLIIAMLLSIAMASIALAEKPPGKYDFGAISLSSDPVDKTCVIAMNDPVDRYQAIAVAQLPPSSTFWPPGLKPPGKSIVAASLTYYTHDFKGADHTVASTETWHKIRGTPAKSA